jgi:TetR/AcrR family transcriptional repressor of nem operon
MATLTETTDLKPGSIYAAFKSKEGLFLAALDHYGERSVEQIREVLSAADTSLAGVRAFLYGLAASTTDTQATRSCFLLNTILEVARHNTRVCARVNHHLDAVEVLFLRSFEDAQVRGELTADADPRALAAFIMASIWGLRILLATGTEPHRARTVVEQVLRALD